MPTAAGVTLPDAKDFQHFPQPTCIILMFSKLLACPVSFAAVCCQAAFCFTDGDIFEREPETVLFPPRREHIIITW